MQVPVPRARFAGEAPRAAREYAWFLAMRRRLLRSPQGDGRPVLFLPGFTGSDVSTRAIRRLLRDLGYHTHAWRLGRNWGPTDKILDGLRNRVAALLDEHGRPLTLIGHSLGGVYSREIARAARNAVHQVITLGSPFRRPPAGTSTAVGPLFRALSPVHSDRVKDVEPDRISRPIPVPLTAILTKTDGVVPWQICVPDPGSQVECIEVKGSHSGLIHNPAAISVILDRLAQKAWEPYAENVRVDARVYRYE